METFYMLYASAVQPGLRLAGHGFRSRTASGRRAVPLCSSKPEAHGPARWGGRVRIAGEETEPGGGWAASVAAPDPAAGALAALLAARRARRRRVWVTLGVVAALLVSLCAAAAYELGVEHNDGVAAAIRPTGTPRNVPTGIANLMELSAIPGVRAPGFTLTDQRGHTMSLASLRGKVVVLGFMDTRCADICPVLSREFVGAYHRLGAQASKVVFAAVNVDPAFASARDAAIASAKHGLTAIPDWQFFTGPGPALRAAWHEYDLAVYAPNQVAGLVHSSTLFFIGARGAERFLASPMVGFSRRANSHLPADEVAAWAEGIARVAGDLAR
jgi:cytochrome oxidase Cu insertion factor (SCO1/SenC/PrrC family)